MREQQFRRGTVPLLILAVASVSGWSGCASTQSTAAKADSGTRTIEDVIPLTTANIRGHRMLYNEGWFVITSSRKALAYARDKSIVSSGEAIREAQQRFGTRSSQYAERMTTDVQHSLDEGKERIKTGTDGEDLPPGTMLNLREMQKAGEEIYALPVSDEDMKNVVHSVDRELPAVE